MNNLLQETIHEDDLQCRIQGLDVYVVGRAKKDSLRTYKISNIYVEFQSSGPLKNLPLELVN